MTAINRNLPSPLANAQPADGSSRLENLYKTLEELRKQLRSLHKQLDEAGDIGARMAIRHQINAIEEMVRAVRQQIMVITQLEKHRHGAGPVTAGLDPSTASSADGGAGEGAEETTYKPPYDSGE